MTSFYNLLRIFLMLYLGLFTYSLYQLLFFHQKRFLFIKTILFFFCIAILVIKIDNKYDVFLFHAYIFFYLAGILLSKKYLGKIIKKQNKEVNLLLSPFKKICYTFLKICCIPPFIYLIKKQIRLHKYYQLHPHLKPKSIYELY